MWKEWRCMWKGGRGRRPDQVEQRAYCCPPYLHTDPALCTCVLPPTHRVLPPSPVPAYCVCARRSARSSPSSLPHTSSCSSSALNMETHSGRTWMYVDKVWDKCGNSGGPDTARCMRGDCGHQPPLMSRNLPALPFRPFVPSLPHTVPSLHCCSPLRRIRAGRRTSAPLAAG